jgi:hypothetical protein
MINNITKRKLALAMLQELKGKVIKEELINWFIDKTERGSEISGDISVKDLIALAGNIGIEVKI